MEIVMGTGRGRGGAALSPPGGAIGGLGRAGTALALLGLSACIEVDRAMAPPPVNPSSPIAAYAERVSEEPLQTPSLKDVPPKVADVRPAQTFKGAVVQQIDLRRALESWWAGHPPMSADTEGFAEQARGRIPRLQTLPVPNTHDAESEAFARRLREAAQRPQ